MKNLSTKIKERYELSAVQHMTDFNNLESILKNKKIFSKNSVESENIEVEDISNKSVQRGRAETIIDCTNKPLHDYVPLYWGKKTPMVSILRDRYDTLIFLMFSTNLLIDNDCVVCDGNARDEGSEFTEYKDIDDLDCLDATSINTVKYRNVPEIKRCKQAELLVQNELSLDHLAYIVCFSNRVKTKIQQLLATHCINCRVYVGRSNYYYLDS